MNDSSAQNQQTNSSTQILLERTVKSSKTSSKVPLYVGLTGYGPFMNILENPSADLEKSVAEGFSQRFRVISNKIELQHYTNEAPNNRSYR